MMENNMTDQAAPELLPCPFCVEQGIYEVQMDHGESYVECRRCDAYGPNGGVTAWNSRADLAAPSAPAEVEGLVERWRHLPYPNTHKMVSHPDGAWVRYHEFAEALTALQAEIERLRAERDALDRKWTTAVHLAAHAHNTEGDPGVLIDAANARAEKAEAERYALEAALEEIKEAWDWWRADSYDRAASVVEDAISAAHAQLKGGV